MLFNKFNPERFFRRGIVPFLRLRKIPLQHPARYKSQYVCTIVKTNTPHPPRDPPENYNPCCVNHSGFECPENVQPLVFRPLAKNDVLGPNASKEKVYKNPEYYAYHRFSHIDIFMNAMRIRMEKRMEHMSPCKRQEIPCKDEKDPCEAECEAECETDNKSCAAEAKKSQECETKPDEDPKSKKNEKPVVKKGTKPPTDRSKNR